MKTYSEFNEGILSLLTKKGREKQAKVSRRLKGVRKTRDKDEADWKAWQSAKSKAAGMGGTKADAERSVSESTQNLNSIMYRHCPQSGKHVVLISES